MTNTKNTRPTYHITKRFISGLLEGLTITETTSVHFNVGFTVAKGACGTSGYIVTAVTPTNS